MDGPGRAATQRGRMLSHRGRTTAEEYPLFQLLDTESGFVSGVENLPTELLVNGTRVAPTFRYNGRDANGTEWDAWGAGETLTAAGSGGSFNAGSPYLGAVDDSVGCDGTRYWAASNNAFADITTEDIVIEAVLKLGTTATRRVFEKREAAGDTPGYAIIQSSTTSIDVVLDTGPASVTVSLDSMSADSWNHVMFFLDRSGSGIGYANATAGSATAISGAAGSLTSSVAATVGAGAAGSLVYTSNIAYIAMWAQDALLDTHAQASLAQERLQRLNGLWPNRAAGSKLWTVFARASAAMLDKWEGASRKLYLVGAGHPCMAYRKEKTSGADFKGYLSYRQVTNRVTHSQDFSNAAWTKAQCTVPSVAEAGAPDGTATLNIIHEDATAASTHEITFTWTGLGSSAYLFAVLIKAANRSWAHLEMSSATDGNAGAYFNVGSGAVGTATNLDSQGIEEWGNGLYLCWIRDTRATAEDQTVAIRIAESDNDATFDGLDQDSLYAWGAQIIIDIDYPHPYIPTSGATVTRQKDVLYFKGDDGNIANNQKGTLEVISLLPDMDNTGFRDSLGLSDGGSGNEVISVIDSAADVRYTSAKMGGATQWAVTGTSETSDGDAHTARVKYETDRVDLYIDGTAEGTPDTSCTPADDLDRIHIGTSQAGGRQLDGLVRNIRIWPKPKAP